LNNKKEDVLKAGKVKCLINEELSNNKIDDGEDIYLQCLETP